ncbi:hypothetical protein ISF_04251 [Cordyceps fumosorosea ARSEF 2679]|uniref:MARVEL-like domain protein n=1 Tax=Cordyceps fumosorosea (strain ARSEF 2679) TaxID=1081104 RepID=A0A167XDF7_CORFA|nr:hypothetical protein ISF_04251 [Cordyceps fumosorosea ARSEF 2679]OAA64841.1 hypothetical protein ISF_04251 [Cordyceps fumosorosea ARSEF 2679]
MPVNIASVMTTAKQAAQLAKDANAARAAVGEFSKADKGQMGRNAGRAAINHGAGMGMEAGKTWLKTFETIPRIFVRLTQFVMALAAAGFYGNRVDADRKAKEGYAPEWLFAVIICGLSAVTSVFFLLVASAGIIPGIGRLNIIKTYRAWAWDATLCVAWLVIFGMFAGIFLNRKSDDPYKGASVRVMKVAVWVDLVSMIFWMLTAVYGCLLMFARQWLDGIGDRLCNMFSKKKNKGKDKGKGKGKGLEMENYSENV